jgi:hypothetical protein
MRRLGREVRALQTSSRRHVVKCDICDQEFANSEEVKRHKEQVHPMGEEEGEKPDLMERPPMPGMEPREADLPELAERRNR